MKTIDRANAAKRLKENPDFIEIMRCVDVDIFDAFKNTKLGEADELQNVHALAHGYKLLNQRIDKYIEIAIFEASKDEDR